MRFSGGWALLMKSSRPMGAASWIRRQPFFAWLWVIGRSGTTRRKGRSRKGSAEVDHRSRSVRAGTVEQPSGQQPACAEGMRWHVSTSGLAQAGLGWPTESPGGADFPNPGLGWPRSAIDSVLKSKTEPGPESGPDRGEAAKGDGLSTTDVVSRETANQGGEEHLSEREQLAASLPA